MSISTYSGLQAMVIRFLHRSDLNDLVADFITLAESGLNRVLTLCSMEQTDTLTLPAGSRFIDAPAGIRKPIALWAGSVTMPKLTMTLPENMLVSLVSGPPSQWAIDGERIAFNCPADQAYTVNFRYVKKLGLSDEAPTNWVLREHPDVYLYAALAEAAPYMRDDQRQAVWQAKLEAALVDMRHADNQTRAAAPLITEIPTALNGLSWRA